MVDYRFGKDNLLETLAAWDEFWDRLHP